MVLIIIQVIFANSDLVIKLFYNDRIQSATYIKIVIGIFNYIPTFAFSIGFGQIAERGSQRFSVKSANWIPGEPFTDELYYKEEVYNVKATHDVIRAPSTHYFMMKIFNSMYLATFLWWYGDHVISSNRGRSYGFFFLFTPSYWYGVYADFRTTVSKKDFARKKRVINEKNLGIGESENETLESASIEKQKVIEDEQNDVYCDGLRIVDLSKTFRKFSFGGDRSKDVHAVK